MSTDTVLVVAWLVLAHLVADFVLQNDWIALNKGSRGREGWLALGTHGFHVGLCLVPAVLAWGWPGLFYLVLVAGSHMAVDKWKVSATRRSERVAVEAARGRAAAGVAPSPGLGRAWSPWPGLLFLADQLLHMTFAIVGWLVILQGVALLPGFVDVVNRILRDWDRGVVHAVLLTGIVLVSLFLVNTRGAYYFVMAMASRREIPDDEAAKALPNPIPAGATYKVWATVAGLERLLIVAFVMVGMGIAAPLLLLAEVVARFRQLDDRGYAEWFLLATLASMIVAFASGVVAAAALGTLGG